MSLRLFLVAGEPSGDRLGAALMAGLKQLHPDIRFEGIGGPLMMAEGLVSLFDMEELSVMGLQEILPRLRHLFKRAAETTDRIVETAPDALITIDLPEFSLRVAKRVKARAPGLRTIHYVAPTVWAWRPKRAAKMARFIDHVLALFPFEPPYMQDAGMTCDFVGHPVATEPVASAAEAAAFRADHGIAAAAPLLLVLPGSRRSEVERLSDIFGQSVAGLRDSHPDLAVVLPAAGSVAALVAEKTAAWPVAPLILDPREIAPDAFARMKRAAFRAADVGLAASGTVSLELAAAETPMVIAYNMPWLSHQVIERLRLVDTVTLVNLVSDTRVVPDLLARDCRPDKIVPELARLLDDPVARQAQIDAARLTMDRLGQGGEAPGLRAARSVLSVI